MVTAFAYHLDANSPWIQSGRPYSLLRHFQRLGLGIAQLFPLRDTDAHRRSLVKIWSHLQGRQYLIDRDENLLRGFAAQLHAALKELAPADFLFSPSTLPLSYLETDLPLTFCADAPFSAMRGYYKSFSRLHPRQVDLAEKLEADVLRRASLAVYPSRWAAASAIQHYGINPARVAEIPFGANLGAENRREDVESWIEQRTGQLPVRLLFIGRDWKRKRGDLVLDTAGWLRRRGLLVHVDVVGCARPLRFAAVCGARWHGDLNPVNSSQRAMLTALFQQAHFVFVPSRAEAYGMSFCEANAFGVPVVTTATGGISEIVRDGVNGIALPLESGPEDYGRWIEEKLADVGTYAALAKSSFEEFATRLNWNAHCQTFIERVRAVTGNAMQTTASTSEASAISIGASPDRGPRRSSSLAGNSEKPTGTVAERPLHAVFVTDAYTDPTKISSWSGTPYFAKGALERQGVRFTMLHLDERAARWARWMNFFWYRFIHKKRYVRDRHPRLLRSFNRQISSRLREIQPDIVFSMGTAAIAHLKTDFPIAFWVDASFAGMLGFYRSFADLASVSLRDCEESDRAAICGSELAIYSSEWAAESARRSYPVDPQRVHFVNLGANLAVTPDAKQIREIVSAREKESCRLLFVGVDWWRKGADQAIAIADALRAAGIGVKLTIIGCHPPVGVAVPEFVEVVGFLNKQTEEGQRRISQYFQESHFFVLPTKAEAYGMVFCEASAFALPSLAPRVGGIPSIVEDGVNGWLLPPDAPAEQYARLIATKWTNRAEYEAMALECHRVYAERLNWDSAARRVVGLMRQCVRERQALTPKPLV